MVRRGEIESAVEESHKTFPGAVRGIDAMGNTGKARDRGGAAEPRKDVAVPTHPLSLDPTHLALNMQIQLFVEVVRGAMASQSRDGATQAAGDDTGLSAELQLALSHLQTLFARVHTLTDYSRQMYMNELENVSALLVFTGEADRAASSYLDLSRREMLADQLNSALLGTSATFIFIDIEHTMASQRSRCSR